MSIVQFCNFLSCIFFFFLTAFGVSGRVLSLAASARKQGTPLCHQLIAEPYENIAEFSTLHKGTSAAL